MLLKLPHAVISSHTHQTAYEISGQITAEVITSVGKCKPRRSREQATTKTSATAPIDDLRWNTLTRSHSASEKRLQAQLRTVRIIMTDTMTAAAVCPLGKLGSPGNRPDPIEVTGRGLSTTHLMPVTYSIGVADTTMSLMTILLLPVMRISMAARMTNNMMHPMVENMYASTVEQSCKYSGHVDSACSTRVSRVVTIAEFRSVMPIIGTRPHSMAVAITTAAVLFFVCIPRMVTAYLPSVYLGWRIPPILPRQYSRGACWWWIRIIPGRAKARRGFNRNVCGGVLLSHTLPGAVPSPCQALASGFGKGPGVTPGPWPPQKPPSTARTPKKRDPRPAKRKTTHAPPPARAVTVREPASGREHRFVTTGTTLLVANNPAAAKTRTHPHTGGNGLLCRRRPLVPVGSTPRGASTSGLSNTCSTCGLQDPEGPKES